jgi:peptidyl-dipeptidase Dcp
LRAEKAGLLGYDSFAAYKLDDTMAKTPDAVEALLGDVWSRAIERAEADKADLAGLIAEEGGNHDVAAWDWRYYSEKLKARRFDFSESQLKPYLSLDKMIDACFDVAGRLFGIVMIRAPGSQGPASRCARVRGRRTGRDPDRDLHRRLLRPSVETLRRLDERARKPAPARHGRRHKRPQSRSSPM